MRQLQLRPVREDESENHRQRWRRRAQILGSLLHWAHDAGATRVEFDSSQVEPFLYTTPSGESVKTELGTTPTEYVDSLAQWIRDTIDGNPLLRPFRRLSRKITKSPLEAEIEILPTNVYSGSTWHCKMNGDAAVFTMQSTNKPTRDAV